MTVHPKVSVLIPTFNYAHFIDESIQSVLEQTYTNFELIVVDNCSTDNTNEVVQKYLTDSRVRFYRNEANIGLVGNWNRCLDHATGEYIKFLCADDKIHPEMLQKYVAVMDHYPNVSLVTSGCVLFGTKQEVRQKPYSGLIAGKLAIKDSLLDRRRNWFGEPTAVMFRKAALTAGKFNAQLKSLVDWEYWLRILAMGDCYIVPENLYYIRHHPETQTAKLKKMKYESHFEAYRFIKGLQTANTPERSIVDPETMNELLRKRAIGCVKVMYSVIPNLYQKEIRKVFFAAFRIGYSEGVLFTPLFQLIGGKRT